MFTIIRKQPPDPPLSSTKMRMEWENNLVEGNTMQLYIAPAYS